jgi:hypothetical protein
MDKAARNKKVYLSRRVCGLCEQSLDRIKTPKDCCSMFGERCTQEIIDRRRDDCLSNYKPRKKQDNEVKI